jgi:hypothetical protein
VEPGQHLAGISNLTLLARSHPERQAHPRVFCRFCRASSTWTEDRVSAAHRRPRWNGGAPRYRGDGLAGKLVTRRRRTEQIISARCSPMRESGTSTLERLSSAGQVRLPRLDARAIVNIRDGKVRVNLPPLNGCQRDHCRCYFRPWDISLYPIDTVGKR